MRITIELDDGLAADLKRPARAEGKSLSAVIVEVLRAQIGQRQSAAKPPPFRLVIAKGTGLRHGVEITTRAVEEDGDIERWTPPRRR